MRQSKRGWLGALMAVCGISLGAWAQDPDALQWSTYMGGEGGEFGTCVAVGPTGIVVATGYTESADFPLTGNALDQVFEGGSEAFVVAYDANGNVLTSTFLGGADSNFDEFNGIAFDTSGNVYLLGTTASPDLPVTPGVVGPAYSGGPQDFMIIKLNPTCDTILAWTYLGTDGDDQTWENSGIALDSSGNVYIAGQTRNATTTLFGIQPNQSGNWDGIVVKLSGDLTTLHYATYLGGTGLDRIHDVAVNASGELFVVGETRSTDFPVTGGSFQAADPDASSTFDAFVAMINTTGTALVYSTYVGGSGLDNGWGIALEGDVAIISGVSTSTDLPVSGDASATLAGGTDAFVLRLNATGTAVVNGTFFGGEGTEAGLGLTRDGSGQFIISGETNSQLLPTNGGVYSPNYNGGLWDNYIARISNDLATINYVTYLGGSDSDHSGHSNADSAGNIYLISGSTVSTDFPVTAGAFQSTYMGTYGSNFGELYINGDATLSKITIAAIVDTDSDGMPDWWEEANGTNPAVNDAAADPDADDLTNLQEYGAETDPLVADADLDGLVDSEEVAAGTSPQAYDTDGDLMSDRDELRDLDPGTGGTQNPFNPLVGDSTGDSGNNAGDGTIDGNNDYDGDTWRNIVELRDGTNPLDPASFVLHPVPNFTLGTPEKIATVGATNNGKDYLLNWSPDGKSIGYTEYTAGDYFDLATTAHQVQAVGSAAPALVTLPVHLGPNFTWGADGTSWWTTRQAGNGLLRAKLSDQSFLSVLNIPNAPMALNFTRRNSDNFAIYTRTQASDPNNFDALAVDEAGNVLQSPLHRLTNFEPTTVLSVPSFSPTGNKVAFGKDRFSGYVLRDALSILNGVSAPPASETDPRIVDLGVGARITNFSSFSNDGETVFFSMDTVGTVTDQFSAIDYDQVDFDIALTASDGSSGIINFPRTGDQTQAQVSPGGSKIAFFDNVDGSWGLYVANLDVAAATAGDTASAGENGATNDGINDIVTTDTQSFSDVSQTEVTISAGTVIDFPIGAPQEITISTPIAPVEEAQLPAGITGIPVVREFGPSGTTFSPFIVVTVNYTDNEVAGLDEENLQVFSYNELSGIYDEEVAESDIVLRDPENNVIKFKVTHFSLYGLGAGDVPVLPLASGSGLLLLAALIAGGGALALAFIKRAEGKEPQN